MYRYVRICEERRSSSRWHHKVGWYHYGGIEKASTKDSLGIHVCNVSSRDIANSGICICVPINVDIPVL
jgi:hypothetical protein